MKRFIIVSVLVLVSALGFSQSLGDKAYSFIDKAFDKAILELDAIPDVSTNTSTDEELAAENFDDSTIAIQTGKTSKGEDYAVYLHKLDEEYYEVFLYGYTTYGELVEISYQSKELAKAAYIYHSILEDCVDKCMPKFSDIVTHLYLHGWNSKVGTYTSDRGTGVSYCVEYEDFLYFFR